MIRVVIESISGCYAVAVKGGVFVRILEKCEAPDISSASRDMERSDNDSCQQ